jgi:hypothetical protein
MMLSVPLADLGLLHDLHHVLGREELALLDVHGLPAARHRLDEVGLADEERGGLQDVDHLRHRRDLVDGVHVGEMGTSTCLRTSARIASPSSIRDRETHSPTCDSPCRKTT